MPPSDLPVRESFPSTSPAVSQGATVGYNSSVEQSRDSLAPPGLPLAFPCTSALLLTWGGRRRLLPFPGTCSSTAAACWASRSTGSCSSSSRPLSLDLLQDAPRGAAHPQARKESALSMG